MVGFHIEDYCINFLDCCHRRLGCRVDRKNLLIESGSRLVKVSALPIGIPFNRFQQMAEEAPRLIRADTGQKIILGVDRLDYTKGLVHRLKAFERFLEKHPEHIEGVYSYILILLSEECWITFQSFQWFRLFLFKSRCHPGRMSKSIKN